MTTPTDTPESTVTVTTTPMAVCSGITALIVIQNSGTVPVRVLAGDGHPATGHVIAPGATIEVEPWHERVRLVADQSTTVLFNRYDVEELRQAAAEYSKVPVDLIKGRTKNEMIEWVNAFTARERARFGEQA